MFFFKRNNEQIQEIQHMLEKCNLNIKDLSETLDLNEKDVNRAMSGSIKQKNQEKSGKQLVSRLAAFSVPKNKERGNDGKKERYCKKCNATFK